MTRQLLTQIQHGGCGDVVLCRHGSPSCDRQRAWTSHLRPCDAVAGAEMTRRGRTCACGACWPCHGAVLHRGDGHACVGVRWERREGSRAAVPRGVTSAPRLATVGTMPDLRMRKARLAQRLPYHESIDAEHCHWCVQNHKPQRQAQATAAVRCAAWLGGNKACAIRAAATYAEV